MTASPVQPASAAMPSEEEVARLEKALRHAATTASNDDYTKAGSTERARHVARIMAILEAADALALFAPILAEKERELAELKGRLAVRMDYLVGLATTADRYVEAAAEARALAAEAKLAQAVEALGPFAKAAGCWDESSPDETLVFGHYPSMFGGQTELRFADFRRARSAAAMGEKR